MPQEFKKDLQYYKFCLYGFLKNQRFFDPFFILFLLEKELSYVQIGAVYSVRMIIRLLFEIPSGVVADVLGRRGSMIFSYSCYLLSFLVYYLSKNYGLILLATFIFAVGDAFRTGTHKALIFEYLKIQGWENQKVFYYGHTRAWSQRGSAISSLIAAALVFSSGNYSTIFLYTGIPYLIGLILLATYPGYLDGKVKSAERESIFKKFKEVIVDIVVSFKDVRVLKAVVNISSYSGYFTAIKDYLQPVLSTMALSIPLFLSFGQEKQEALIIGITYFILYFITSAASKNSGKLVERFKHYSFALNWLMIIGLLAGLISGIFYKTGLVILAVVLFVFIYAVENARRPAAVSCIAEMFDKKVLATILSVESQVKDLIGAVLAMGIGLLADRFDVATSIIVISLIMLLLSPAIFIKPVR
ncbi:MAG: MFS transporter [Bacteroidales bacterium]|nr:MFS transporter [Bacteroidales bacterium]